jgi:hypothetical protein
MNRNLFVMFSGSIFSHPLEFFRSCQTTVQYKSNPCANRRAFFGIPACISNYKGCKPYLQRISGRNRPAGKQQAEKKRAGPDRRAGPAIVRVLTAAGKTAGILPACCQVFIVSEKPQGFIWTTVSSE